MQKQPRDNQVKIIKDATGRTFRRVYCMNEECGKWLADEYINRGRLRLCCTGCGRIMILVFRHDRRGKTPVK